MSHASAVVRSDAARHPGDARPRSAATPRAFGRRGCLPIPGCLFAAFLVIAPIAGARSQDRANRLGVLSPNPAGMGTMRALGVAIPVTSLRADEVIE